MSRIALTAMVALLSCHSAAAQTKKQSPKSPAAKSALDKPVLEAYLRHQFMIPAAMKVMIEDPKPSEVAGLVSVDVLVTDGAAMRQNVQFFVSKDGSQIIQGKVFDVRQAPFAAELKLLKTEGAPALGSPAAPVTVMVFSDFQCGFCKEAAKMLRANVEKSYGAQVRVVFKDFPLEQIHNWAKSAAMIGRCVQRLNAGAFWEYHDWIFEHQAQITKENLTPKALEFANSKNLDALQLTQCIEGRLTEKIVDTSMEEARALQITSTPTL
ncbi:MAG TPA: DsbA family protein, partial [Bryobacteraceae bacterium]|nr:DsbA family protein [Bryobacteraceae bacterium]